MPYTAPASGWVTLRSRTLLETAMADHNLNGNELARRAHTSRQNIANIRRNKIGRVREDIAGGIERALGVSRGYLFDYRDPPAEETAPVASAGV